MANNIENLIANFEQRWQSLTIADDFVFGKVMLNEDICREVLETILEVPIDHIEYIGRQEDLDETPEGHGIRLDVYVRDGKGTVYDVEMQATNTGELPQRSRYYQAMLTFAQLSKGLSYRSLNNTYVIFICNFDLFGLGQRVYSFENCCTNAGGLALGDGSHTVFLAASAPTDSNESSKVNELLDYVSQKKVSGDLSSRLDTAVSRVLSNQNWRLEFMIQVIRDQLNVDKGRQLGFKEGHDAGLKEGHEAGLLEGHEAGLQEGRAAGMAEGHEAGLQEGRQVGREEGESRLANLVAYLIADGRIDEVSRISSDQALRTKLYKQYGIL